MKARQVVLVFGVALVVFMLVKLPLAAVLAWTGAGQGGLTYGDARGTVWDGQLRPVTLRTLSLGTLEVGLSPWTLPALKARARLVMTGGDVYGTVMIERSLAGPAISIEHADLVVDLRSLETVVPLLGSLAINGERFTFGPDGCQSADFRVESDVLRRSFEALNWRGPVLSGTGECRGPDLVLDLKGASDQGAVEVVLLVSPDLGYDIKAVLRDVDEDVGRAVIAMGFTQRDGAYHLKAVGTLVERGPET